MANYQDDSKSITCESVIMDSRKLLSALNNSDQSRIAYFDDVVGKMGEKKGKNWKLAALQDSRIFIEDVDTNDYYTASYAKKKFGKIVIEGIKKVVVKDQSKSEFFYDTCFKLVESIENDDKDGIDASFNKLQKSRFRPTTIPESGIVKTKDGQTRRIKVESSSNIDGSDLAERIIISLTDKFMINEDTNELEGVVLSNLSIDPSKLGVSELTSRKIVAKKFQEQAENASLDETFQKFTNRIAALVSNDKLEEAVKFSSAFLLENQEFCLLNRSQWDKLVSDTLAIGGCFNDTLSENTSTVMYKTNLKINKDDILESWHKTAVVAEHPVMLENVQLMKNSDNFPKAYDKFLGTIFEAVGETTVGALITGLELLKKELNNSGDDDTTIDDIDELVTDLKTNPDNHSVWTAMETLDGARRGLEKLSGLDDFDSIPDGDSFDLEDEVNDDIEDDIEDINVDGDNESSGDKPIKVTVEIDPDNIGKTKDKPMPELDEPEPDLDLDDLDSEGEDDLDLDSDDDFLNDLENSGIDNLDLQSKSNNGDVVSESIPDRDIDIDAAASDSDENIDDLNADMHSEILQMVYDNYGGPGTPIEISQAVKIKNLYKERFGNSDLAPIKIEGGNYVIESVDDFADEFLKNEGVDVVEDSTKNSEDIEGYQLPDGLDDIEESINLDYTGISEDDSDSESLSETLTDTDVADFNSTIENDDDPDALIASAEAWIRNNKDDLVGGLDDDSKNEEVTKLAGELVAKRSSVAENQAKVPTKQLSRRGLKKSAINALVKEHFEFISKDDDAFLAEFKNVEFIIDNSEKPVAILSKSGDIQLELPEDIAPGALYFAELSDEEANADLFIEWLDNNIESLRESIDEDDELDNAINSYIDESSNSESNESVDSDGLEESEGESIVESEESIEESDEESDAEIDEESIEESDEEADDKIDSGKSE